MTTPANRQPPDERRRARPPGRPASAVVRPSLILDTTVQLVFHATVATALFFLFSGHNATGGGFIAGLVAGAGFVLLYLSGSEDVTVTVRLQPPTVLGAGLVLAAGTAVVPWVLGGQLLESAYTYVEIPVLGELPVTSVLAFDSGVFLIVVGIVLAVLGSLGTQREASLGSVPSGAEEVRG